MVFVTYHNKEIEELIANGKSSLYMKITLDKLLLLQNLQTLNNRNYEWEEGDNSNYQSGVLPWERVKRKTAFAKKFCGAIGHTSLASV